MRVSIPKQLQELIAGSPFEAATVGLLDAVGTILADNSMSFFPAYTDHGSQHVERVLKAAIRLVPDEVWEEDELLRPADGAVLACATALHDLALHIREPGFVALVDPESEFLPCRWFRDDQDDRPADRPWSQLWSEFQREAQHFGTSQIDLLFGPGSNGIPAVAHEKELDPGRWVEADRLLVGEFLRRHHARLGHEIAMHGFPGATPEDFPVLAHSMPQLAEAIGAVARSHNESLRCMLRFLEDLGSGSMRPAGALLLFHMGLLRIADYFQIEADRAPPLLLRLKAPASRLSVEEWNKHGAIASIAWEHTDTAAIDVFVSPSHGLRTHLALADMFLDMQHELDTTTAVLSETFTDKTLALLRLKYLRLRTNLAATSLHEQLPYLPRRAALRSDPDLFRLVIRDLYGNQPAIAGRELVQNAVDAVRTRHTLSAAGALQPASPGSDQGSPDVRVLLEDKGASEGVLRVRDEGVGMTPDLVIDYFLQAGATFGLTPTEIDEFDREEAVATMRAGRFGVGAFAAFLLGPEIEVITRHVEADRGVRFRARIDGDLVQLDWVDDAPFGTEVVIPFDPAIIPGSAGSGMSRASRRTCCATSRTTTASAHPRSPSC